MKEFLKQSARFERRFGIGVTGLAMMVAGTAVDVFGQTAKPAKPAYSRPAPKPVTPAARPSTPPARPVAPAVQARPGAPAVQARPVTPGGAAGTRPGAAPVQPVQPGTRPGVGTVPQTPGRRGGVAGPGPQRTVGGAPNQPRGPQPTGAGRQPEAPVATANRPLGGGKTEHVGADGSRTITGPDHRPQSFQTADGRTRVQYSGGRPVSMTQMKPGNVVETTHRLPGGGIASRTVMPDRTGHGQMVIQTRGRVGSVERPIVGRQHFYRESRYEHGVASARVYREYRYRGYEYRRPVPAYIYSPGFYGWGMRPWGQPVVYGWGWQAQPWYGAYGPYFTPYQSYAGLDQWMTDYVIAANLRLAYEAGQGAAQQQAAAVSGGGSSREVSADAAPPAITPEMKEQIAAQVRLEMAEQQEAAAQGAAGAAGPPPLPAGAPEGPPPEEVADALKPGHTLFRVVSPVTVETGTDTCALTTDDYIARTSDLKAPPGTVTMEVKASRATDCPKGATVEVALNDLMVMEGDQQQRVMEGMKVAADSMGKNGLPTGPAAGEQKVPLGQAVPDEGLADTLNQHQAEATADQQQTLAAAGPS